MQGDGLHQIMPTIQGGLTVAGRAMSEWGAAATGQKQVVTSRVKQHNLRKARCAAGSRRVEPLPSRVVAALVPDKRPDRQRTVHQAGLTLRPKVEGRCGLCRRCATCELESCTRPTLLLLLLERRGACTNTANLRNPEESQQSQVLHSCRCPVRVASTPEQQSARRQEDLSRVRSFLAAASPEDAAPAPAQQSAWDPNRIETVWVQQQPASSRPQAVHPDWSQCLQQGPPQCRHPTLSVFDSCATACELDSWPRGKSARPL